MIKFNEVTWYSKFIGIVLFLLTFGLGFSLGMQSEQVREDGISQAPYMMHHHNVMMRPMEDGVEVDGSDATTTATSTAVACTMEAKRCPDGSFVGRQGPKCEFAACPGAR